MFRLGGSAENEGIMDGMRKRYQQGTNPEDIDSTYTAAGADFKPTNQGERLAAFEPVDRLNRFGSGIAQLISGYPAAGTRLQVSPNPTPLQTALGIGTTLAGIYGDIDKGTAAFQGKGIFS